jgi:hypothetical protein
MIKLITLIIGKFGQFFPYTFFGMVYIYVYRNLNLNLKKNLKSLVPRLRNQPIPRVQKMTSGN